MKKSSDCEINRLALMLEGSTTALTQVAEYFKVLSENSRLQVLCCLRSGEKNVTAIMEATGLGQANVSKHLKILTQAGVVSREQRGVSAYYRIEDPIIFELCELVCERLSERMKTQLRQSEHLQLLQQAL